MQVKIPDINPAEYLSLHFAGITTYKLYLQEQQTGLDLN